MRRLLLRNSGIGLLIGIGLGIPPIEGPALVVLYVYALAIASMFVMVKIFRKEDATLAWTTFVGIFMIAVGYAIGETIETPVIRPIRIRNIHLPTPLPHETPGPAEILFLAVIVFVTYFIVTCTINPAGKPLWGDPQKNWGIRILLLSTWLSSAWLLGKPEIIRQRILIAGTFLWAFLELCHAWNHKDEPKRNKYGILVATGAWVGFLALATIGYIPTRWWYPLAVATLTALATFAAKDRDKPADIKDDEKDLDTDDAAEKARKKAIRDAKEAQAKRRTNMKKGLTLAATFGLWVLLVNISRCWHF